MKKNKWKKCILKNWKKMWIKQTDDVFYPHVNDTNTFILLNAAHRIVFMCG